jgi:hypothetical protein
MDDATLPSGGPWEHQLAFSPHLAGGKLLLHRPVDSAATNRAKSRHRDILEAGAEPNCAARVSMPLTLRAIIAWPDGHPFLGQRAPLTDAPCS